jgi:Site-specific recombinase XerD
MAKVNFFLKEPKAEEETLIYLFFSYNNQRLKYSTGEKIHPDFWNSKDQRVKETKKFPEHPEFNFRLSNLETIVKNVYRRLLNDGLTPTNDLLKNELNIELKKKEKETPLTLFEFIDKFIEECKDKRSLTTIKSYITVSNHLRYYCALKNLKLDFADINISFYNSYISYLSSDLRLSQNTIGTNIKVIKTFLNEATERGYNTNIEFKSRKFKKLSEDTDKIYLNTSELDKIYKLDLSQKKRLERVRDLFIIGCYTGLRFSDFIQLTQDNIIENNKIKIRTQKTNETVVIPLHPYVKTILSKYDGNIPTPLTNQKMNDYLKEIGQLAEINEKVITSITKGGQLIKESIEKFNLISTHTARRSFASNLYLADVPAITIMKITGHKTEKSFLRYIRISQEENANKLLNHPFFS